MRWHGHWPGVVLTFGVVALASTQNGGHEESHAELDGLALQHCFEADGVGIVPKDLFLLQLRAQRAQPAASSQHSEEQSLQHQQRHDPREVLRDFGAMATRMRHGAAQFSARAVLAFGGGSTRSVAVDDCAWSLAVESSSTDAGSVRSYEGVMTAEACLRACLGESTCLAAVFESSTGTCHGVPWNLSEGLELVVPDTSAVVASKKCAQECIFSRPRSGKSPGSVLQNVTVRSLPQCQQLCIKAEDCLSMVFRPSKRSCYLLPRAFDENAEFATDDAMMSNKLCRTNCSFEDPSLLSSQLNGIIAHIRQVSTLEDCQKQCWSNTTCQSVLFQQHLSMCHLLPSNSSGSRHFIGTHGSVISHRDCGPGSSGSEDGVGSEDSGNHSAAEQGDEANVHENDTVPDFASDFDELSGAEDSTDVSVVAAAEPDRSEDHSPQHDPERRSKRSARQSAGTKVLSPPKVLLDGQAYSGKGTESLTTLNVSARSGFSVAFSASWYSLSSWGRVVDLTDGRVGDGSGELLRVSNIDDTDGLYFSVQAGGHESHVEVKDAITVGVTSRFLFSVSSAGDLRVYRDGKLLGHSKGRPLQELAHGQLFLARPTVRQKRANLHTFEGWLSGVCAWSREATWGEAAKCEKKDSDEDTD